jgi:hypothetical protein
MTQTVLGPKGSPRRRWTLLLPFIAVLAFAVLYIAGAQAVNQTGAFELEGNAVSANANPPRGPADDWDRVCHQVTAGGTDSAGHATGAQCTSASNTTGATAVSWVDSRVNQEIYTGGGSKDFGDPQDEWLWKPKDTVPDKDTITHSFAARYSLPKSATTCPAPAAATTCEVIFFGSDRFANDGDAQLGFWFFQNKIETTNTSSQGGFKFSGHHRTGDLLVISDFSVGGTTSTIKVYSWQPTICASADNGKEDNIPVGGCPAKNLRLESKSLTANCATAAATANACGIVSPSGSTPSPWPFLDKTGNSSFQQGELYEAGLNLSNLGFGNECFASVLAESRSSDSTTAVLKDFVLSNFGACTTTLSTTAAGPTGDGSIGGGSVSSGVDNATLTINGAGTWAGTLDFYLCGPIATGVCDNSGVKVSTVNVTNATTQPIPSGNGTTTGFANLTSAGRYCWFSKFTPDAQSAQNGVPEATDNGSGSTPNKECFTVTKVTPTLTTCSGTFNTATPPVCTPASAVDLGTAVSDRALLAGAAKEPGTNGGAAGKFTSINATNGAYAGTISFLLKGPASTGCGADATGTGTNPQSVNVDTTTGNKEYGPVSFTPSSPGAYHWQATYTNTGSANNTSPVTDNANCNQAREDVTVNQVPTAITTRQSNFPQDAAKITVSGGLTLSGNVRFKLYDSSANCTANGATGLKYDSGDIAVAGSSPQTRGTNNTTFRVTDGTTYYWNVTYTSSTQAQLGSSSTCTETTSTTFAGNDTGITIP